MNNYLYICLFFLLSLCSCGTSPLGDGNPTAVAIINNPSSLTQDTIWVRNGMMISRIVNRLTMRIETPVKFMPRYILILYYPGSTVRIAVNDHSIRTEHGMYQTIFSMNALLEEISADTSGLGG